MTLLSAVHIQKSYGTARVLDDVTFEVRAGEIHALVGENGAGKSTLIKIIGGAVVADAGDVRLGGESLPVGDPVAVRTRGVSIVYQEFALVPDMTVAENVFLGRELGWPLLRRDEMRRVVDRLLGDLAVRLRADERVRDLSAAHQQMVEIARALVGRAKVLIFDEPTASLSSVEVNRLADVLRRLREQGLGIIYVSHRLEEVFALADRVTVLRDGRYVRTDAVVDVDRRVLVRAMVGREVSEEFPPRPTRLGDVLLEVVDASSPPRFESVSFTVRAGEIVGLAGLVGAGRTSLGLSLVGAVPSTGKVLLHGRPLNRSSPAAAITDGLVYVTEDRKARGILPLMDVAANITLTFLSSLTRASLLIRSREDGAASHGAREFDVRAASLKQRAGTLSGGNQQKMLLARFLLKRPAILILDEPTRGVDVGARADIYALMNRLTEAGMGIVLISSDLPEILGMSDRVLVMRQGRCTGELARDQATPERVMTLATGQV